MKPPVTIDWETAEYLSCLIGQIPWGNPRRRRAAAENLGKATEGRKMETSQECFKDATWDIIVRRKDHS